MRLSILDVFNRQILSRPHETTKPLTCWGRIVFVFVFLTVNFFAGVVVFVFVFLSINFWIGDS